jgi:hypothetical protein
MSKNPPEDGLEIVRQECRKVIERNYKAGAGIDSSDVARIVAKHLDPPPTRSPAAMYLCALQGLVQIAGAQLRMAAGAMDDDDEPGTIDAFGYSLQRMYPVKREKEWGSKPKFLGRDFFKKSEWETQVVAKLAKLRDAYSRHHDLAVSWGDARTDWPDEE